ncbi:MAG: fibronectin type III domain-containing protein [Anaerolineales bacterium]
MKRLAIVFTLLLLAILACTRPGPGTGALPAATPPAAPLPDTPSARDTQEKPPISVTQSSTLDMGQPWAANLAVSNVNEQTVGPASFASSTRLLLAWQAPEEGPDHYLIVVTKLGGMTALTATAPGGDTSLQLDGLESSTSYEISLQACLNVDCSQSRRASDSAVGVTAEEYWQLQGAGNGYDGATRVVEGGNNIAYVIVWGPEAGPELSGRAQLYYHPFPRQGAGYSVRTAVTDAPVSDLASLSRFIPTESGLQPVCDSHNAPETCPADSLFVATYQAVPLLDPPAVRLYFEAQPADAAQQPGSVTRLYSLDSVDGYQGQDFNPDPGSTVCGGRNSTDFSSGGNCEPRLEIGLQGDGEGGESGLTQARQSKIGYPQRDSWLWDGAAETFIVITGADACGQTQDGLFYALPGGAAWQVTKDAQGCARPLALKAHGPVVVHLGEGRYKLYYEDSTNGHQDKPFRVIYADAARSGDPDVVEFDDWETAAVLAREVNFLWPDGSQLDAADESGLGDHMILVPGDDPDFQVMYMNLGGLDNSKNPGAAQGIGIAVLLNP